MRTKILIVAAVLGLLAAALAATAGADSARSDRHRAEPRRVLDPTRGLPEAHPDVPEDAAG